MGIVVFGDQAEVMVPLDKYTVLSDLLHVTQKLKYMSGLPDIANAIRFVDEEVFTFESKSNILEINILFYCCSRIICSKLKL